MEHILRISDEVWGRLEAHQARLSAAAGRHVSLNEALLDLIRPRHEFERCECSPDSNPGCPIAGHPVPHEALALWFTEDAANPEDDVVVCAACRAPGLEGVLIEGVVVCECSPEANPGCEQGSHAEGHIVPAQWRVSEPADHDDFIYLCNLCTGAATARRGMDGYVYEVLEQAGGDA